MAVTYITGSGIFIPASGPYKEGDTVGVRASFTAAGGESYQIRWFLPDGVEAPGLQGNLGTGAGTHTLTISRTIIKGQTGIHQIAFVFPAGEAFRASFTVQALVAPITDVIIQGTIYKMPERIPFVGALFSWDNNPSTTWTVQPSGFYKIATITGLHSMKVTSPGYLFEQNITLEASAVARVWDIEVQVEGFVELPPAPSPTPVAINWKIAFKDSISKAPIAGVVVVSPVSTSITLTDGILPFTSIEGESVLISCTAPVGMTFVQSTTDKLTFRINPVDNDLFTVFMVSKVVVEPPPPPPPPAPVLTFHEIDIKYLDPFGVGDKLAAKAGEQETLIRALLPSNFTYTHYTLDTTNNVVTLYITEEAAVPAVLPLLLIVAIVAVVIALIGFLFVGYVYRENKILKATLTAKEATKVTIQTCLDDLSLTPAQLRKCIQDALNADPDIVIPPPGDGLFGGIADTLKFAMLAIVGIALLQAMTRNK